MMANDRDCVLHHPASQGNAYTQSERFNIFQASDAISSGFKQNLTFKCSTLCTLPENM